MRVDVKKLAMESGLLGNLIAAGRTLLDNNIKHIEIGNNGNDRDDAKGTLKGSVDLILDVDGSSVHIDLADLNIQIW